MILYPAIDLKDGQCVRLLRGEMTAATVFGDDPAAQAAAFQAAGCDWLHLVDLNGAFAGTPVNGAAVEAILARVSVPCQLGRRHPRHGHDREAGSRAASPASSSARSRSRTRHWCARRHAPSRARSPSASTPARAVSRRTAGRKRPSVQATDLARSFEDAGVAAIIYTDIDRDGAMQGPNVAATAALARAVTIPVIASGGVSSMADLLALRDTGVIAGAISGRALYDGAIDLGAAIRALRG